MLRSEYASETWLVMLSASAMPTDALEPSVSPRAVVADDEIWVALSDTAPLTAIGVPDVRYACEVTLLRTMAIDGATETPPPDAPVFASVVIAFSVEAPSVRSWPPLTVPKIVALAVSSMSASANAAPTPTEPAPLTPLVPSAGRAVVVVVDIDVAVSATSPVPAFTVELVGSVAVV